jgi:hypothetical protein
VHAETSIPENNIKKKEREKERKKEKHRIPEHPITIHFYNTKRLSETRRE